MKDNDTVRTRNNSILTGSASQETKSLNKEANILKLGHIFRTENFKLISCTTLF